MQTTHETTDRTLFFNSVVLCALNVAVLANISRDDYAAANPACGARYHSAHVVFAGANGAMAYLCLCGILRPGFRHLTRVYVLPFALGIFGTVMALWVVDPDHLLMWRAPYWGELATTPPPPPISAGVYALSEIIVRYYSAVLTLLLMLDGFLCLALACIACYGAARRRGDSDEYHAGFVALEV